MYGGRDVEPIRRFLRSEPIHPVETGPYLIARNEVTYNDYIEFLDAQSPDDRAKLLALSVDGPMRMEQRSDGKWRVTLMVGAITYKLDPGVPLVYSGRTQRASVAWEQLPVTAITTVEASAYMSWLDRSRRLPGARYCNEHEWERAARGADGRLFASGDDLEPSDANIMETYGKDAAAFGPDPVGSYPQTISPFGLHDTDGNAFELTVSPHGGSLVMVRGGAYYYSAIQGRTTARFDVPASLRDTTLGLRVCATWPTPAE